MFPSLSEFDPSHPLLRASTPSATQEVAERTQEVASRQASDSLSPGAAVTALTSALSGPLATALPNEDTYVARRMAETLADVYATIIGDDNREDDDALNAIERVKKAAQVLRLEVDLYRAQRTEPSSPANLEGLRKKLLTPRKILRDDQGFLTHPEFPVCDEGTRADKFLEAFGIETRFRSMENDLPDLHERWCNNGLDDCSEWTPTPPEGDGWLLLSIYDTDDGPYAMYGRDKYEAENALKRQRTRELSERIQQRQAQQGDTQS